jgi:hypothetical protein
MATCSTQCLAGAEPSEDGTKCVECAEGEYQDGSMPKCSTQCVPWKEPSTDKTQCVSMGPAPSHQFAHPSALRIGPYSL